MTRNARAMTDAETLRHCFFHHVGSVWMLRNVRYGELGRRLEALIADLRRRGKRLRLGRAGGASGPTAVWLTEKALKVAFPGKRFVTLKFTPKDSRENEPPCVYAFVKGLDDPRVLLQELLARLALEVDLTLLRIPYIELGVMVQIAESSQPATPATGRQTLDVQDLGWQQVGRHHAKVPLRAELYRVPQDPPGIGKLEIAAQTMPQGTPARPKDHWGDHRHAGSQFHPTVLACVESLVARVDELGLQPVPRLETGRAALAVTPEDFLIEATGRSRGSLLSFPSDAEVLSRLFPDVSSARSAVAPRKRHLRLSGDCLPSLTPRERLRAAGRFVARIEAAAVRATVNPTAGTFVTTLVLRLSITGPWLGARRILSVCVSGTRLGHFLRSIGAGSTGPLDAALIHADALTGRTLKVEALLGPSGFAYLGACLPATIDTAAAHGQPVLHADGPARLNALVAQLATSEGRRAFPSWRGKGAAVQGWRAQVPPSAADQANARKPGAPPLAESPSGVPTPPLPARRRLSKVRALPRPDGVSARAWHVLHWIVGLTVEHGMKRHPVCALVDAACAATGRPLNSARVTVTKGLQELQERSLVDLSSCEYSLSFRDLVGQPTIALTRGLVVSALGPVHARWVVLLPAGLDVALAHDPQLRVPYARAEQARQDELCELLARMRGQGGHVRRPDTPREGELRAHRGRTSTTRQRGAAASTRWLRALVGA